MSGKVEFITNGRIDPATLRLNGTVRPREGGRADDRRPSFKAEFNGEKVLNALQPGTDLLTAKVS